MQYQFEGFELDTEEGTLLKSGEPVELKGVGLTFLTELVKAAPAALSPDELAQRVWNRDTITTPTIKKRITAVHEALGVDLIEDVQEGSYALTVPVNALGEAQAKTAEPEPETEPAAPSEPEPVAPSKTEHAPAEPDAEAEPEPAQPETSEQETVFKPANEPFEAQADRPGADPAALMRRAMIVGGVFMAVVLISVVLRLL